MNIAKALVVDDSKLACVTLSRMLEKRAIHADCVGSGEEALEYLKKTRPDIIFLDVIMQGMDGYQTARAITNNTETSNIPVFVCSSNDTAEDRERARQNGATGFLTKPPNQTQLDDNLSALREKIAAPASGAHTLTPPAATGEPSSAEMRSMLWSRHDKSCRPRSRVLRHSCS